MDDTFKIVINNYASYDEDASMTFGVYSHTVTPPDPFTCVKNQRMYARLFCVVSGEIIFNKNTDKELTAPSGSIVFLPEDITYKSQWATKEEGCYITFIFFPNAFYITLPDQICIAAVDTDGSFLQMFSKALDIWNTGALGYKLEVLSELYKILHKIYLDSSYKQIKSKNTSIYKGILYIENHYLEEFDISQIARMCHLSESSFRRHFKEYKKMAPITYRNYLRIKKAKELIKSGECSITEAAMTVNLPDICYFHKLFKKFYNTTPGKFIP